MKRSAPLLLVCLNVVLCGCAHVRLHRPTREVSFPELAEIVEGRMGKLKLSKGKTRTAYVRALRPDSLVYSRRTQSHKHEFR